MGESDSRTVAATKRRITDGLFEIMRDDPIERVTVREVCARARITRSTFYTHFSSVYDVRDRCEAEIAERVEEALGDHFDHLAVLLNGGDPAFVERARAAAMGAVCAHLGICSMSERQALVFYGTSSMLLGMFARWLSSDRAMPLEELVATARAAVLRGPARAMLG